MPCVFLLPDWKSLTLSGCQSSLLTRLFVWKRCSSAKFCQLNKQDQHTHFPPKGSSFIKIKGKNIARRTWNMSTNITDRGPVLPKKVRWRLEMFKTTCKMQVKDQVQMLLVQDLLDTLSKSMDILPYRRFGGLGSKEVWDQNHNSKGFWFVLFLKCCGIYASEN